jgi:hypothetical protein
VDRRLKEKPKEPCKDSIFYGMSVARGLGTGRQDVVRQERDVQQLTTMPVSYRLARGFSILRGGSV